MDDRRSEKIKRILKQRQPDLTVITDNVNNVRNLSAIIRCCEAVGMMEVHSVNQEQDVYLINKVTAGAEHWLNHVRYPDMITAINHLRERGFTIYATHLRHDTLDYRLMDYTKPSAFIVGSEKKGVSQEALDNADYNISIPMMGMTESLNVAVATGIIVFEAQRQRQEKGFYQRLRIPPETYEKMILRRTT